ncbi:MAG: amino acid adenylation domain-containing protein, partial [Chitinophagaceae bacterium]
MIVRSLVQAERSFSDIVQSIKEEFINGIEHAAYPFPKLVSALNLSDADSKESPFRVFYAYQNIFDSLLQDRDLFSSIEKLTYLYQETEYDYSFEVHDFREELEINIKYNHSLFHPGTIKRHLGYIRRLLMEIIDTPEKALKDFDIVPEEEKHRQLMLWNGSDTSYPKDKTIVDLFSEQVERTPGNIAVVYEENELTYKQLDELSDQAAHALRQKGVREESMVAICIERSIGMIVGIIGILKAGGTYVPIEPSYPKERISYILEDTGAVVVICDDSCKSILSAVFDERNLLVFDPGFESIRLQPRHPVALRREPHHAAYVIYTSGSTGRPKGVVIEDKNVVRLFKTDKPVYDFSDRDVWTMFHSFCFDFSVWEMYGALFYGGRLVIVPKQITQDSALFGELLLKEKVTVLNQTPSSFYVLQDYLTARTKTISIRYVIFGGEALNPAKVKPWHDLYRNCKLINMYGITETTVHVTYQQLTNDHIKGSASIIGIPIPTLHIYILNDHKQLVPLGVTGELYVGGEGVARCYLNLPELSAQKFIDSPFVPGERLYRSGDLARWLEDGSLEYLGRIDDQVKIRGYRIELGEIETAVQQSGLVTRNVIIAKTDKTGTKHLIGYVVPTPVFSEEGIVESLKHRLPGYMIPSHWVTIESIPLTSNGKVDRKKLPDPVLADAFTYKAPGNELESQLCEIYAQILGLEKDKVSVNDDFFRMGGDSIVAIRLAGKINNELHASIRVKDIFQLRTVSSLAQFIFTGSNADTVKLSYTPFSLTDKVKYKDLLDSSEVEDIYPAAYLQMGMLYESDDTGTYHDVFRYRINKTFNHELFTDLWKQLITKHALLRARFIPSDNGYDCAIYKWINWHVECFENADHEHMIEQERFNNFNFDQPGLFRLIVNKLEGKFDFIFSFHHAIADGWSIASLINEFVTAYSGRHTINNGALLNYGEFISKEQMALNDGNVKSFWLHYLDDYDFTHPMLKTGSAGLHKTTAGITYNLTGDIAKQITSIARSLSVSVDVVFLNVYLHT